MTWDKSKPPESGDLISSEVRQNWEAIEGALGGVNLVADPYPIIWPAGDSAAPAHYTLAGSGAAVARTGTGLADTNRKIGAMAAKVTAGAAIATLTQALLTTTSYDDAFDGIPISFGAWVRATNASAARLLVQDGTATTRSSYHTGGSSWEWLTVVHAIDVAATKLELGLEVASSQAAHMTGLTALVGDIPPARFIPSPCFYGTLFFPIAPVGSNASTGTSKAYYVFARPAIVKDVQVVSYVAPTGAALIVDVNRWDSGAQSMFSTRPQIAASAYGGYAVPEGTYQHRCFAGYSGTDPWGNKSALIVDVDQVGSTEPGEGLSVCVRALQFSRPLEAFLGVNE